MGGKMRRWWGTLGRGEQVGLIGVAATLVVGLAGALPAYFAFIQDSGERPARAISTSSDAVTTTTTLTIEPTTTSPETQSTTPTVSGKAIGANWSTTAEEFEDHIGE